MDVEALEPRFALAAQGIVRPMFVDVVPGNTSTNESIFIGGSRANAVNFLGDHDWYRVSLTAGTRYQFNLNRTTNSGIAAMGDPYLTLRSASGSLLASDDDGGGNNNSQITYTPTSSGRFYLDAGAYRNGSTGGYTLYAVSLGSSDDYAASTFTTGRVTVGGSATGRTNTVGDRDWFRVYLVAGQTYQFNLTGGTNSDPLLRFRNGFGTQLAENDDYGGTNNSRIVYRPLSTGYFFLDAGGYGSNTGTYTLRVTRTA